MERLFDAFTNEAAQWSPFGFGLARTFPALNLWEDTDALYAEAEVPGLSMDDLEVSVMGNELSIRGERKDQPAEGVSYHRRERGVGGFSRVVRLPGDIDAGKVQANLRDGVLTITLPKAEATKPRKIQVRASKE